jgi:hypothetical protein
MCTHFHTFVFTFINIKHARMLRENMFTGFDTYFNFLSKLDVYM